MSRPDDANGPRPDAVGRRSRPGPIPARPCVCPGPALAVLARGGFGPARQPIAGGRHRGVPAVTGKSLLQNSNPCVLYGDPLILLRDTGRQRLVLRLEHTNQREEILTRRVLQARHTTSQTSLKPTSPTATHRPLPGENLNAYEARCPCCRYCDGAHPTCLRNTRAKCSGLGKPQRLPT